MDKENVSYKYNEILFNLKAEGNSDRFTHKIQHE